MRHLHSSCEEYTNPAPTGIYLYQPRLPVWFINMYISQFDWIRVTVKTTVQEMLYVCTRACVCSLKVLDEQVEILPTVYHVSLNIHTAASCHLWDCNIHYYISKKLVEENMNFIIHNAIVLGESLNLHVSVQWLEFCQSATFLWYIHHQ